MARIGVLVPSQRPQNIARLAQTMSATCQGDTALIVGVDADDPKLGEYHVTDPELMTPSFRRIHSSRTRS